MGVIIETGKGGSFLGGGQGRLLKGGDIYTETSKMRVHRLCEQLKEQCYSRSDSTAKVLNGGPACSVEGATERS